MLRNGRKENEGNKNHEVKKKKLQMCVYFQSRKKNNDWTKIIQNANTIQDMCIYNL